MSLPLIVGIAALLLSSPALPRSGPSGKFSYQAGQSTQQPQTSPAPPDQNAPAEQPKTEPPSSSPQTPAATSPQVPEQPKSPETKTEKKSEKVATSSKTPTAAAKKTKHHKKKSAAEPSTDGPKKVVVRHGSTADPEVQFTPGMSQGQAHYQKQTTEQLLAGTEANLKTASARQLQPGEQDSVEQIKSLMEQSKLAIVMGDLQRARTLAVKAQLLSNELVRH
jgi:outer membrane biosynthesis protein TonB